MPTNIPGFTRTLDHTGQACVGVFGAEGSGKTRLAATAGEWALERDTVPGWIICDRKTRKTLKEICLELRIHYPLMNSEDFVTQKQALELATNESFDKVKEAYGEAVKKLFEATVKLAAAKEVDPIIIDSGTQLWDWIAYSHFGRKQDAGKARVWGPPKQDWTDLLDALSYKTVLITLKAKDEWVNKTDAQGKDASKATGNLTWDGPPHLGYTTTSIVRLTQDHKRKLEDGETFVDRFSLDVIESQDNKGIESMNGVLTGAGITFSNLMALLRAEEE